MIFFLNFFSFFLFLLSFSFSFLFRYSIIVNVFEEIAYICPPLYPSPSFPLFFSKKVSPSAHISLFLTEINPPLSGQISGETWYISCHLSPSTVTVNNQITSTTITQTYIYFPPYSSLVFRPFPSLYTFLHSQLFYLFSQLLKCRKIQKMYSLKKFFCE